MKNIILFEKRKLILCNPLKENNEQLAMTFNAELMQLGFCLDIKALNALSKSKKKEIEILYAELIPYIKTAIGANHTFKPFYKNFPQEVMSKSDFELWLNATIHYLSEGKWEPEDKFIDRGFSIEKTEFQKISLGTEKDFEHIFTTLLSSNGSLTQRDKDIVNWYFDSYKNLAFPDSIPFKETLCQVAVEIMNRKLKVRIPVKTATDVLRIATYMSKGDISLPMIPKIPKLTNGWRAKQWYDSALKNRESFKFRNFKRFERIYLLSLLDNCKNVSEDMWRYRGRWLRLGEKLHPGDYAKIFSKTFEAFNIIRNAKVVTYNSKVEQALDSKDLITLLHLLSKRPGEFARRLDDLLRDSPVLTQLYGHFKHRLYFPDEQRSVFIKGKKSKKFVIEKQVPKITKKTLNEVSDSIKSIIGSKFSNLEKMGKVYIAPELYNVPVPAGMRSANTGLRTLIRGARIPFGDFKVLRAYTHWFDRDGNQDIDLSANFFDENFQSEDILSFRNLKLGYLNSCHSGDIRMRKGACAEYVDIDIDKCLSQNIRYVVLDVRNFQNGPFTNLEQCVFGWMGRDFPESDMHFKPNTVQEAISIVNESTCIYVAAIDLKTREIIWLDTETNGIVLHSGSKSSNSITSLDNWRIIRNSCKNKRNYCKRF